jgi:hypothetical protein
VSAVVVFVVALLLSGGRPLASACQWTLTASCRTVKREPQCTSVIEAGTTGTVQKANTARNARGLASSRCRAPQSSEFRVSVPGVSSALPTGPHRTRRTAVLGVGLLRERPNLMTGAPHVLVWRY